MNQDPENQPEIGIPKSDGPAIPIESAEFEDLRDLVRLCRQNAPPEPSPIMWSKVFAEVQASVSVSPQARESAGAEVQKANQRSAGFRGRWLQRGIGAVGAAAAVLLILAMGQGNNQEMVRIVPPPIPPPGPNSGRRHGPIDLAEVPIADLKDFTLVSMRPSDADLLLVGKPLVTEPLNLMGQNDVELGSVEPDEDDFVLVLRTNTGSPMMISPIKPEKNRVPSER